MSSTPDATGPRWNESAKLGEEVQSWPLADTSSPREGLMTSLLSVKQRMSPQGANHLLCTLGVPLTILMAVNRCNEMMDDAVLKAGCVTSLVLPTIIVCN